MKAFGFLLLLLFLAAATAADEHDEFPVLYCTNPQAEAGACAVESTVAVQALIPWFVAAQGGGDQGRQRRDLLDCSRFCDDSIPYFTLHAPCDCSYLYRGRRRLPQAHDSAADEDRNNHHHYGKRTARHLRHDNKNNHRQLQQQSPIQLLETFIEAMRPGKCKEIFQASHCFVTFVSGGYTGPHNDSAGNNMVDAYEQVSSHGGSLDAGNTQTSENTVTGPLDDQDPLVVDSHAEEDADTDVLPQIDGLGPWEETIPDPDPDEPVGASVTDVLPQIDGLGPWEQMIPDPDPDEPHASANQGHGG